VTLTTPLVVVLSSQDYPNFVQNLNTLASAVPNNIIGAPKLKMGHATLITPLSRVTCYDQPAYKIISLYLHRLRIYERRRKM